MASANELTHGQQQALAELHEVSAANPAALEIMSVYPRTDTGWLPIEISLATSGAGRSSTIMPGTGQRARMRARERFIVSVPPQFPFIRPEVSVTHERFADLPHVQWQHTICLYLSPTTEWHPSDGMFGFLERLIDWIDQAAAGTLDPVGGPLHPPVAYTSTAGGLAIIRADTPHVTGTVWLGYAVFKQSSSTRVELVGWLEESDAERLLAAPTIELLAKLIGADAIHAPVRLGLAVLLAEPTTFEFPTQAHALIEMLIARGVNKEQFLDGLARISYLNRRISNVLHAARQSVHVVVGTPMRGIVGSEQKQHLAVWRLPTDAQQAVALLEHLYSSDQAIVAIASQVRDLVSEWLDVVGLDWAQVYEERPEVIVRRDRGSPLEWVRGRTIAIIGCGALGGHVAEHFARAGVARLLLVDNGKVSPGVLIRQPYGHDDIGTWKVDALRQHLHHIRQDLKVDSKTLDALRVILDDTNWPPDVDLIIDAAANPAITAALERQRRHHADTTPTILSLLIGHTSHCGLITLAPRGYSGGGMDLLRKVKISALDTPELQPFADEFFPDPPRTAHFQPEPGCSEATFVGSHAEVSALTATMLTHALATLSAMPTCTPSGYAVLTDLGLDSTPALVRRLSWPQDITLQDQAEGLEVRIAPAVLAEIRAECRLMVRRRTWRIETGGLLLGEIDDACSVAWITSASGPPPDSRASAHLFVCGVEGVEELVHRQRTLTRGAKHFVGLWHSHPGGQAAPSRIDNEGMDEVVVPMSTAPRRALLLIIGATKSQWIAWLAESEAATHPVPDLYTRLTHRLQAARVLPTSASDAYIRELSSVDESETRRWPPSDSKNPPRCRWWRRRK
jgi:hypothetical protein